MAYVPPLNGGRINASIGGNSTSAGAGYVLASTGTFLLAGGNNVTLSQNGASVTISGANQSNPNVSLYALGNTTQNSSTQLNVSNLSFNGLGMITAGYSNGSIQLSATQSNQDLSLYALGNTTQNSSTVLNASKLSFNGLGNITVGFSNGSIQISETGGGGGGGVVLYDGANSITSGTARFSNSNGVSFGFNGQTITGSVAAQSNQSIGLYGVGNTTQNSSTTLDARTLSFNGLGGITVGYSNGSIQLSGPTTAAQTNQSVGLYGVGNTTQNSSTTLDARTLSFNGLGGITVGYSNGSIQLSGPTTAAQSNQTVGLYALGNTTQNSSTTLDARTMSFNGLGAATMGYSNGSIQVSAPATSSLSASGGLSISTNGSTISIGAPLMSQWMHNSAAVYSSSTSAMVNTSVSLVRMLIPEQLSFSRVDIPVSFSGATAAVSNTAAMAISAVGVIYSRNGSTLNAIVGQSSTTTYSYASNTGVYSSITGPRLMSFNLATSITAGEYYFGFQLSSATSSVGANTTNLGWTLAPVFGTSYTVLPWQDISAATNQTINLYQPLQGMNSVSISNTSQTHQQSQITQSGATAIRANLVVILRNN
jgi:hypothetical protein